MDWIQQWQSKLNKQNGVAPLVRTGGSRHTGLAALPYRNIQLLSHSLPDQPIASIRTAVGIFLYELLFPENIPAKHKKHYSAVQKTHRHRISRKLSDDRHSDFNDQPQSQKIFHAIQIHISRNCPKKWKHHQNSYIFIQVSVRSLNLIFKQLLHKYRYIIDPNDSKRPSLPL